MSDAATDLNMIAPTHNRSYLFAPGHNAKLVKKVFTAGADAVILDLEDGVPADAKERARAGVAAAVTEHRALVRVNAPRTPECAADVDAVAPHAAAIRIPKCESPEDVAWVAQRAHGVPLVPAIETARGVLAAQEIAAAPGVAHLSIGGLDLLRDLYAGNGTLPMLYVRSHLVVVSRAADLPPPVDSVYPLIDDDDGLRAEAEFVRSLGFAAKSAIHPRQIPRCSRRRRGTWSGRGRCWRRSRRPMGARRACRTASSSTGPWRNALSGCWTSPLGGCRSANYPGIRRVGDGRRAAVTGRA